MTEAENGSEIASDEFQKRFEKLVDLDRNYDARIAALFQSPHKLSPEEMNEITQMANELYALEVSFMYDVDLPALDENKKVESVPMSEDIPRLAKEWVDTNATYDKEFQELLKHKIDRGVDVNIATQLREMQQKLLDLEKQLFEYCSSLE